MEQKERVRTSFINIPQLIDAYKRIWKWVIASVLFFLALGVLVYLKREDKCEVVAQVLISDESSKSMPSLGEFAGLLGGGMFGANRSVEDEMVIIKAHSVLKQTVMDLDMNVSYRVKKNFIKSEDCYYDQPVKLIYDKSIADTLGVTLKFEVEVDEQGKMDVVVRGKKNRVLVEHDNLRLPANIETPYGLFTLAAGTGFIAGENVDEKIRLMSFDGAAILLDELITVDLSAKKTDIMSLSYVTTNDLYGKTVLDTLVENYNNTTIQQKRDFNYKTLQFLEERIALLSLEVDSTEAMVEDFMGRKDLVDPRAQAGIYIGRTSTQEVELVKAEAEYELLTMAIDFLGNEANNTSMLPIMPSTASLTPLINGYNDLILRRLTIESSAKGDNKALKAINTQIIAVRDNLLTALNKQSETANVEITEMRRQYAKTKNKLSTMPGIEREYTNILRQQSLKEQLYMYLLRQREETEMTIAGAHPRGIIIDEAFVADDELGMSPKVILAVFFMLGICMPAAFILVKWMLGRKISIADQAVDLSGGMPLIARIPLATYVEPQVTENPDSVESERFRLLRSNILSLELKTPNLVINVAGTCDDAQSTRVALNVAASFALTGRRVALVETNPFKPMLADVLNAQSACSLQRIIGNKDHDTAISKIALNGNGSVLHYVPSSVDQSFGEDMLASIAFENWLSQFKKEFDVIVLSGPSASGHFQTIEVLRNMSDISLFTFTCGETLKSTVADLGTMTTDDCRLFLIESSRS